MRLVETPDDCTPDGQVTRKALVFHCMAVAAHISTQFTVTEMDWAGHVHYEAR
jgi:hypothetical protein